jgi:hypothetical protein
MYGQEPEEASEKRTAAEKHEYIRHHRLRCLSIAKGSRLMGLSRSTCYDVPSLPTDNAALVAIMIAICDEFEAYANPPIASSVRLHLVTERPEERGHLACNRCRNQGLEFAGCHLR